MDTNSELAGLNMWVRALEQVAAVGGVYICGPDADGLRLPARLEGEDDVAWGERFSPWLMTFKNARDSLLSSVGDDSSENRARWEAARKELEEFRVREGLNRPFEELVQELLRTAEQGRQLPRSPRLEAEAWMREGKPVPKLFGADRVVDDGAEDHA